MKKFAGKIQAFGHEYPCTVFVPTDLDGNILPNRKADVRWFTHGGGKEQNRKCRWTTDPEKYGREYGVVLITDMDVAMVPCS